jgi:hypothetical protein
MLFAEFFPRLQARALHRYGQGVSERQFKDWRENGFIAGPDQPVGQGRGRSPHRHWPAASYRRALRICRYRNRGCYRTSLWLIGFWLAGDSVDLAKLRDALRREYSVARREGRSFREGRWLRGPFSEQADLERGGASGAAGIGKMLDLSPEEFRLLSIQQFEEPQESEDAEIMHTLARKIYEDVGVERPTLEEVRQQWRAGHMNKESPYFRDLTEGDISLARETLRATVRGARLQWLAAFYLFDFDAERLALFTWGLVGTRAFDIRCHLDRVFQIVFGIVVDRRDGNDPRLRLASVQNSNTILLAAIAELTPDEIHAAKAKHLSQAEQINRVNLIES